MMRYLLPGVGLLLAGAAALAQAPPAAEPDPFAPLRFMAGTWRGRTQASLGAGRVSGGYAFELAGPGRPFEVHSECALKRVK